MMRFKVIDYDFNIETLDVKATCCPRYPLSRFSIPFAGHSLLIKVMQLDLADLHSVAKFVSNVAAELKGKKLSILVINVLILLALW